MKLKVALATFLVAGLTLLAPAASANSTSIIDLSNGHRSEQGLSPLCPNPELNEVAQTWSQHMADTNTLAHNSLTGTQIPTGWQGWGENVATVANQPHVAQIIVDMWMASPGHKENILRSEFTDIGVGLAVDQHGIAWSTQVFATYPTSCEAWIDPPKEDPVEESPTALPTETVTIQPESSPTPTVREKPQQSATSRPTVTNTVDAPDPLVRDIQQLLQDIGYGDVVGVVDGFYGDQTKEAILLFQEENKLQPTGVVYPGLRDILREKKISGWDRTVLSQTGEQGAGNITGETENPTTEVKSETVISPSDEVTSTPTTSSVLSTSDTSTNGKKGAITAGQEANNESGVRLNPVIVTLSVLLTGVLTGLGFSIRRYLSQ